MFWFGVLIELVWFGSLVDGSEGSSILAVREEAVLHCFHLLSSIYRINKLFKYRDENFIPPQNQLIKVEPTTFVKLGFKNSKIAF